MIYLVTIHIHATFMMFFVAFVIQIVAFVIHWVMQCFVLWQEETTKCVCG